MRRREFITLLGCAAATWPLAARAQQASRLGVLLYSNPSADQQTREVLRELADLGYIEGRHISLTYRYAEGNLGRLPVLAAELVRLARMQYSRLVGMLPRSPRATATIPTVFISSADPVQLGLVEIFAGPAAMRPALHFSKMSLHPSAWRC